MHGEQIVPFRLPLWVISGHRSTPTQCPLYPQKRTLVEHVAMSAMCQKRTLAPVFDHPVGSVQWPSGKPRPSALAILRLMTARSFRTLALRRYGQHATHDPRAFRRAA